VATYYIGDNPTNYVPFDHLQTIQHFIMPNFATMNWEKVGHHNALNNFNRLHDDEDAVYDDIMLYIHIPYCLSLCHYCNFNKFAYPFRNEDSLSTYVEYLIKELDYYLRLPYVQSRRLTAVYFGGGSPSVLPIRAAARIFEHLTTVLPNWKNLEKTFTGEPRTLKNPDLLQLLIEYGFNRVTFGVESFNEEIRKQIGRWDTLQDVAAVFSGLEKLGYEGEKDIDLMFDLPGQTLEGFQHELEIMMRDFQPDELDAYGTIYLPYRALHKLVVQEKRPQPGNAWQLLKMREYLYDFMTAHGYHNTIAETWSKNTARTEYQTAHCARQNIIGIGTAARSNFKDMVSINPEKVDTWMKNIDQYGVSTATLQSIGREGVLARIMVMFPRYKEMTKEYFAQFSDAANFDKMRSILRKHIDAGVVDEHNDRFTVNKLGVIWICNLQTDYMQPSFNILGNVLTNVLSEKRKNFDTEQRFKVNALTQFIANNLEKYPKLMK
jgi:coproporphyrinogen III oxidase-like Fe-S oxidoreductase